MDFNKEFIDSLPLAACVMDTDLRYAAMNREYSNKFLNIKSTEKYIGYKLCEIESFPHSLISELEEGYKMVLSGQSFKAIQIMRVASGEIKFFIGVKSPLFDRGGNIVSILIQLMDIYSEFASFSSNYLNKSISNRLDLCLNDTHKQGLTEAHQLNKNESRTIFFLVKGFTVKQIATILGVSNRSVEYYLESARDKLGCKNRSELVEYIHIFGLHINIPDDLFSHELILNLP